MFDIRKVFLAKTAAIVAQIASRPNFQKIAFNALRLNRAEARDIVLNEDLRFLAYCLARRDRSRSQILQDLWVCFELGEKVDGYFVEFGATNGLTNSNTWFLEKNLGWKGILAEPNPVWHADLALNRTASMEHKCVSSRSGEVVTFITTNDVDPELSAIETFSEADHFAQTRNQGERMQIETISLDDLLDKYQAPLEIDYLSIDTEGSELAILSSYSFRRRFKLISVEVNPKTEPEIHKLLLSKGYKRVFKHLSQWDSWYVSAELRDEKTIAIVAPAS